MGVVLRTLSLIENLLEIIETTLKDIIKLKAIFMSKYKVNNNLTFKKPDNSIEIISWGLALIIFGLALFFFIKIFGVDYICSDIVAGACI